MNRPLSSSLTIALVLASQWALGGCNKKEDVDADAPHIIAASAPDVSASASDSIGIASVPMDSISSASAVAASYAASGSALAASR